MIGLAGSGERKNPYPFSFANVTGQSASTLVSTSIVPAGFNGALTATVSGPGSPSVRKNGSGSFGSTVVLFPGDTLNLQLTSSGSYNTATVATVSMGTFSASWSVTTASVTPGSQNFTTPGTFNFVPSPFNTITIAVKGAGEGGWAAGGYRLTGGGGKGGGICVGLPDVPGANGGQSSFGPTIVAAGGTSAGAGTGSGGNSTNDTGGAAGGAGGGGGIDPDCGRVSDAQSGFNGGRAVSVFSIGGLTVGANYTVVVGLGGDGANNGGDATTPGANGSVSITWS